MRTIFLALVILHISGYMFGQNKVLYHKYSPTASSWDIVEWNTKDTANYSRILKETIDEKGRVIQLEFLKNGELVKNRLCYLPNKVTFEYKNNLIIETYYSGESELVATDCEMPYMTIYHLDEENYIEKIEVFSKYDFTDMDSTQIKQWKEWVPEYIVLTPSKIQLDVSYYYHSFSMLNGLYPVSKGYILIEDYYYGDEPEKSSIKKGLEKLSNGTKD